MHVTTVGLDLSKNVFQAHGLAANGEVAFNRSLRRAQVLPFFERLENCVVGMEACGTRHHWARELSRLGHDVRLIPPAYVKPYVKSGKSDAVDAEAVCEAVTRPSSSWSAPADGTIPGIVPRRRTRFVAIKSTEQQAVLFLHRARDLIVRQRTQLVNMARGMLAEFGIAQGIGRAIAFAASLGVPGHIPVKPDQERTTPPK